MKRPHDAPLKSMYLGNNPTAISANRLNKEASSATTKIRLNRAKEDHITLRIAEANDSCGWLAGWLATLGVHSSYIKGRFAPGILREFPTSSHTFFRVTRVPSPNSPLFAGYTIPISYNSKIVHMNWPLLMVTLTLLIPLHQSFSPFCVSIDCLSVRVSVCHSALSV